MIKIIINNKKIKDINIRILKDKFKIKIMDNLKIKLPLKIPIMIPTIKPIFLTTTNTKIYIKT
jgi:hypothetical protein